MIEGKLGKYEITGTLGRGAMGVVYDGRDPVIERRVAIKTINLPDTTDREAQDELARFKREAQAAGRLQHPNIVGIYDYGETDRIAYIVMEFVDGTSLKSLLERDERFPAAEAVRVMTGLLAGLHYSHERGVVHRDIKPANVMITSRGVVKIADFGIARIESSSMTQAGTIMGTPAYMSPEQFMGNTVDARTDIYSAGAMLYQMLTGDKPFTGSQTAIMHKALNTVPPRPSELSVTAPPGLDPVVATAMAKRPEDRYATAAAFSEALAAGLSAPALALPESDPDATMVARRPAVVSPPVPAAPAPVTSTSRPSGLLIAAAAVGVVVLAGGAYLALRGGATPDRTAAVTSPASPPVMPVPGTPVPGTPMPGTTVPITSPPVTSASVTPPVVQPVSPAPFVSKVEPAPVVPVVPPHVAPAQMPPVQTAEIARTPAALRSAIATALAPVPCSLVGGSVAADGAVTLEGVAPASSDGVLHSAVQNAAAQSVADWRIGRFDGPYCPVLDVLRPIAPAFGQVGPALSIGLKAGAHRLRKDEYLIPRVTLPDFPSYLRLDYFTSDGGLSHLMFAAKGAIAARRTVLVGDPKPSDPASNLPAVGVAGWQIDVPFGTDMIVAIASDKPLFDRPRPDDDTAAAYLRDLRPAIDDLVRRGGHVEARAMVVETAEK